MKIWKFLARYTKVCFYLGFHLHPFPHYVSVQNHTVISGLMSKIRSCEGVDESLNRSAARFLRWLGSSWRDCTKRVQCTKVTNCIFTRQSLNQHPTGGRKTRITMILGQRSGIRNDARFRRWRWPRWCRGVRSLLSREIYPDWLSSPCVSTAGTTHCIVFYRQNVYVKPLFLGLKAQCFPQLRKLSQRKVLSWFCLPPPCRQLTLLNDKSFQPLSDFRLVPNPRMKKASPPQLKGSYLGQ